jgi:hypothetical protein
MSLTSKRYIVKDRAARYAPIPNETIQDKFYTDTSKSRDRKVIKNGIETPEAPAPKQENLYPLNLGVPVVGLEDGSGAMLTETGEILELEFSL